jgi:hypothetical protein
MRSQLSYLLSMAFRVRREAKQKAKKNSSLVDGMAEERQ